MTMDPKTRAQLESAANSLHMLTTVGCGGAVLAMMANLSLEAAQLPALSVEMEAFLGGPIIVHYPAHQLDDSHPAKTLRSQILSERVDISLGLSPFLVGPSEICAVMFQFMLEQAVSPDVSHVYLWASVTALSKQGVLQSRDEIWDRLLNRGTGGHTPLTDDQVLHEEPYASVYRHLATEIRSKVIRHRLDKEMVSGFQLPLQLDTLPLAAE